MRQTFPRDVRLLVCTGLMLASSLGCAQVRYAQTSVGQAVDNPVVITADWGEVSCGRGTVCAEVEVLRVDTEQRDMGRIDVLLHNRTTGPVAVQVTLEVLGPDGIVVDRTNAEDVALEALQERSFTMPGIYRPNHKVRVLLRQRAS